MNQFFYVHGWGSESGTRVGVQEESTLALYSLIIGFLPEKKKAEKLVKLPLKTIAREFGPNSLGNVELRWRAKRGVGRPLHSRGC